MTEYTRDNVVETLWREGWFIKTAKAIARRYPHVEADDLASDVAIVAMRAAESWNGEYEVVTWVKWRARNAMLSRIKQLNIERNRVSGWTLDDKFTDDGELTLGDMLLKEDSAEDAALFNADVETLRRVFPKLTAKQRAYVVQRFYLSMRIVRGSALHGHWRPAKVKFLKEFERSISQ